MATIPVAPRKDPNVPKAIKNLPVTPQMVFRQEKGIENVRRALKEWHKLSDSKRKKYGEKAKKNSKKCKVLWKKYKETPQYKEWRQNLIEWKENIKKFYPPPPRGNSESEEFREQMRIWKVQCRRIRTTAGDKTSLEGSKWLKKYLVRMGMQTKPAAKDKKSKKSKKKVKKDQLAAITKAMKNVKVKKGTKDKKKGARKLNQNKKGKKLEKVLKKKQAQKKDGLAAITKGMKNVKVKANKKKKKKGVKRT